MRADDGAGTVAVMPRSTSNWNEIQHIKQLLFSATAFHEVQVVMKDGQTLQGRITRELGGNDPAMNGRWEYYGSITLSTKQGTVHELDLLDVLSIHEPEPNPAALT